jgi:hypothetical protein
MGIEPTTYSLGSCRSTTELRPHLYHLGVREGSCQSRDCHALSQIRSCPKPLGQLIRCPLNRQMSLSTRAHMSLIEKYLPAYQFAERHDILVAGPPRRILDAVDAYDFDGDRLAPRLMAVRQLPARFLATFFGASKPAAFGMKSFVPLGRDDREVAVGLAGRFWRPDGGLVSLPDAAAFAAFSEPGTAKLVMTFATEPKGRLTRLVTETRVHCLDRRALVSFTPYWLVIRLPSGLIRRRMLKAIKQAVEAKANGSNPIRPLVDRAMR